jgi:hypothetical protein
MDDRPGAWTARSDDAFLAALSAAPTAHAGIGAAMRQTVRAGGLAVEATARPISHAVERAIAERLRRGVEDGDVSTDAEIADLSSFVASVAIGMATLNHSAVNEGALDRMTSLALAAWPPSCLETLKNG